MIQSFLGPGSSHQLFFVLSGEHDSLPAAEVKAIIESEGFQYSCPNLSYRLLTLQAEQKALQPVAKRSLMYNSCGVVLGGCEANAQQILKLVRSQPLEAVTKDASSFAVRVTRIGGAAKPIRSEELEREVGAEVKDIVPRLTVRLTQPDATFSCVLHGSQCLFGLLAFEKPSGMMASRRPRKRPVFHPSTMPPKIARCMANLSRARAGSCFVDPFCGVGGILIEASVIGCNVVGLDASKRMLLGARRNLKYFNLGVFGFVNADARAPPLGRGSVDAIATDPPYGRGSSTMGVKMTTLVQEFLEQAPSVLREDGCLCLSAPAEVDVEGYAQDAGLVAIEQHLVRVHRSLTRRFTVLRIA